MNCFYCHNKHLIKSNKTGINHKEVFDYLDKRKGLVEAVVISGGEPTIQKGLIDFMEKIKYMGFMTKLDTNGTNPILLKYLIDNLLIDYCAMDIKTTFDKYEKVCNSKVNINNIKNTIKLLMESNIKYEFRTTCYPTITNNDIYSIIDSIKGANYYTLQKYRNIDDSDIKRIGEDEFNLKNMKNLGLEKVFEKVEYKGI